jgi:hypothetical protein
MEVDSEVWVLPVARGCGIGFSPLLESFSPEGEGSSDGLMAVRWRGKSIAVSDLNRGRAGGTVSVADALIPAEAECDRRRPPVDGTGTVSDCVVRGGDIGKGVVISESGG